MVGLGYVGLPLAVAFAAVIPKWVASILKGDEVFIMEMVRPVVTSVISTIQCKCTC